MWNTHTCDLSAQRVALMAPHESGGERRAQPRCDDYPFAQRHHAVLRRNPVASAYEICRAESPFRSSPAALASAEERAFPIDDSAGGCDDPIQKKFEGPPYPWTREHPAIDMVGCWRVSESGQEIYNFCKLEAIDKIVLMGVHTPNICILNRSLAHVR